MDATDRKPLLLDMSRYQWTVLFAAWLGWGFDVFDGLLFNYVAPNCVPTLLHLPFGSSDAIAATRFWTGLLTALLLIGWGLGGIIFGMVADRIGRTRTLLLTILIYSIGTAACAFAPNIWILMIFRVVASLGIGGEWAAGASMVAETAPEHRRVEAGALLYTSAPMGLFLATFVNAQIAGNFFKAAPEVSWRYVFLCGLIPAALTFLVRLFIHEPERWRREGDEARRHASIGELFTKECFPITRSGFCSAAVALITWWSCNAFLGVVVTEWARDAAKTQALDSAAALALIEHWKTVSSSYFNFGGLLGTLLTIPFAKILGRKSMLTIYYLASSLSIFAAFGMGVPYQARLFLYFPIGLSVFGVFGCFTYYLPELFPTRLRATGAGFCYNVGRFVTAPGPYLVGYIASQKAGGVTPTLVWIAVVPLLGVAAMPWIIETKGRTLED